MEVFADIRPLRDFLSRQKNRGKRVILVPTMGALHGGHRSCINAGRTDEQDLLMVSIFVNPTQFGAGEDLEKYPRALDADVESCKAWGCDVVFAPTAETMSPSKHRTWVEVEDLTRPLCGRSRPGHFRGVTTVVSKLFNLVQPDAAVFGQKDAQQALVIREMVRQLNVPVELIVAPTAREPDGLAMSSRNRYLDQTDRRRAASIYRALTGARDRIAGGERDPSAVTGAVRAELTAAGFDEVEYVEILGTEDLSSLVRIEGRVIIAVAAFLGSTRLIDNCVLEVTPDGEVAETALF